jgi:cell wall-associated NlpC family hydrolase
MYYILRTSGVKNVQVTGATSLYNNYMTAIPASEVQPGDFALFCGTYDTTALVSHIGLVVSENLVLHAGDPVKYTRIDTVYYQEHFYTFARLKTE